MRQDIVGDSLTALTIARNQGKIDGPPPIKYISDDIIFPQFLIVAGTFTVTANVYYEIPIYIARVEAFAGVKFRNSGTGNNGDKVKVAMYQENADGTRTRVKDFGEATLDGSAAIRTLASSWTPSSIGWYFIRIVADDAVAFTGACSTARLSTGPDIFVTYETDSITNFPRRGTGFWSTGESDRGRPGFYTYTGTYASFPESTGPNATASGSAGLFSGAASIPAVGLYK